MKLYSLDLFKYQNLHGYGRILHLQDLTLKKAHAFMFFTVIVGLLLHAPSKGNPSLDQIHPVVDKKKLEVISGSSLNAMNPNKP